MWPGEEHAPIGRRYLGLDRPYMEQYASFVGRALRGDFGTSLRARRPVGELIAQRLPNSLRLAAFAMTVSLLLACPLGVLAAVWKGTGIDRAAQVIAVLGQSLPTFWVAIVLIEVVAGRLQWLPAGGIGGRPRSALARSQHRRVLCALYVHLLRSRLL